MCPIHQPRLKSSRVVSASRPRIQCSTSGIALFIMPSRPCEPRREKTGFFAYAKTKTQISFAVTAKLISAFVFATQIVQSLYFLNSKFQASSHLQWLYSPVYVGPGRKPRRPVFSQRGSCNETPSNPTSM